MVGQMLRRLSVHVHASHMHVLYARRVYAGMAPAQADRAGGAGELVAVGSMGGFEPELSFEQPTE